MSRTAKSLRPIVLSVLARGMDFGVSAGCSGTLSPSSAMIVTVNLVIKNVKIASEANGNSAWLTCVRMLLSRFFNPARKR